MAQVHLIFAVDGKIHDYVVESRAQAISTIDQIASLTGDPDPSVIVRSDETLGSYVLAESIRDLFQEENSNEATR